MYFSLFNMIPQSNNPNFVLSIVDMKPLKKRGRRVDHGIEKMIILSTTINGSQNLTYRR